MRTFSYAGVSDIGSVRSGNEDSGFAGAHLLVVADGVGGSAAGEVASATAAYVVSAVTMAEDRDASRVTVLERAVDLAHRQLRKGIELDHSRAGMATTLTAIASDGDRLALAHIGDSRAYLLRAGELSQLSHDHTLVQALVDSGEITAEDARTHPARSAVLRALDGGDSPRAEYHELDLVVGDRVLLCSDGLSDYADEATIRSCLAIDDREDAVAALLAAALQAGGGDNVTCIVADVVDTEPMPTDGMLLGAVRSRENVVDPAAVRKPLSA